MSRQINLGIIGLGNWSRQIFQAVNELPNVSISHCYSRYEDTRKAFAKEYACLASKSYETMISEGSIDGIVVISSNTSHEADVIKAAEKGKHCIVAKPISTTIEAGQRMIKACEENDVILAIGHQSRREESLRTLKSILESGELGDVHLVEANYSTPTGLAVEEGDWRADPQECPGGALLQIGIHVIDTLYYLFGPMAKVYSWQSREGLKVDMPSITTSLLEFETGLKGYLGSTYASSFSHWIKVYGTRKNAFYSELGGLQISEDSWENGEQHENQAPAAIVQAPMPAIVEEMAEFADCIRNHTQAEVDGHIGLHNLAVVLAAVESNNKGEAITLASLGI